MQPSKHIPQPLRKELDRLFASLIQFNEQLTAINNEYEEKTRTLTIQYSALLAPVEDEYKAHAKTLKKLIKARADELFRHPDAANAEAEDKVYTALGVALRQVGSKLKTTQQTLKLCEELGFNDAVKIAKSLDRAALATWPADKLTAVAAEKLPFVAYGFELQEARK